MNLDSINFCYKEYPPIPLMQCTGHKQPFRWTLALPAIIVIALIALVGIAWAYV